MVTVDHHHHLSTPAFVSKFKNILTARDVDLALIAIVQCAALTDVMRASKITVSKIWNYYYHATRHSLLSDYNPNSFLSA